ncbi:MAG: hypothetical protein K1X78_28610 [Verrucomicrobiaceae bacterium]|nr:hypothetical protein [Verrucomicrobiaceae bacterium]
MALEPPNAIGDAKANRQYELTLGLAEDCFLGTPLLINDRTGQTRTTEPKRVEPAKQVLRGGRGINWAHVHGAG